MENIIDRVLEHTEMAIQRLFDINEFDGVTEELLAMKTIGYLCKIELKAAEMKKGEQKQCP